MDARLKTDGGPTGGPSKLVLAGRVVLLLVAVLAVVSALSLDRGRAPRAPAARARYLCPMHPEVSSSTPGECPICRMALERGDRASSGEAGVEPDSRLAEPRGEGIIGTAGRRLVAREITAPARLDAGGLVAAILYNDVLVGLEPGERGTFFRTTAPMDGLAVRLTPAPPDPVDGSTSRAYFRLDPRVPARDRVPALGRVAPGEAGWVKLAARARELLVVPSTAVVNSPDGPRVFVASPGGSFSSRRLEIGSAFDGFAVVVSGLRDGERVVVGNSFFLEAERRLQSARPESAVPE